MYEKNQGVQSALGSSLEQLYALIPADNLSSFLDLLLHPHRPAHRGVTRYPKGLCNLLLPHPRYLPTNINRNRPRFVPLTPPMPPVVLMGVDPIQVPHDASEVRLRGLNQKVIVIDHQAVGNHAQPPHLMALL